MKKRLLILTASAVVFVFGVVGPVAQAQAPAIPGSASQDQGAGGGGMTGGEMMGHGMMGGRMMAHGRAGGLPPPFMMRMMFSLMDAEGDGKLSLQEFQAAHERIFKAMDANKDGFVTLEEMQNFMRGTAPTPQQ
jgi:EF hand domain-containing protein